jgi:hypothetical protein
MNWINRTDHRTALLIQRAVAIELHQGAVAAWAYLTRNDIPEVAISRVLHGPRRNVVLVHGADASIRSPLGESE